MRILLPVDGSLYSSYAADFIASRTSPLAEKPEVEVFNVQKLSSGLVSDLWNTKSYEMFCRTGAAKAFSAVRRALESSGVKISEKYAKGPAVELIAKEIELYKPDLVVMGTKGKTDFDRIALGSVTTGVIARSSCPILLIRSESGAIPDALRVGLPVDGSSHSLAAAKFVAKHAVFFGRSPELLLIHVSNLGEEIFYCDLDNPLPETPGERFGAEAYFDKVNKERIALERMDAEKAFESVRPVFEGSSLLVREIPLTGEVAPAISRCARTEGLHLLVMGTRGLDNTASVTLGSVTSRVLAEGTIPVLVVKG